MGVTQGGSMLVTSHWPHHTTSYAIFINPTNSLEQQQGVRRYSQPWHGDDQGKFEKYSLVTMYDHVRIWHCCDNMKTHPATPALHWEYQLCVVLTFQLIVIGRKLCWVASSVIYPESYWISRVLSYRFLSRQEWLITFLAFILFDIWNLKFSILGFSLCNIYIGCAGVV